MKMRMKILLLTGVLALASVVWGMASSAKRDGTKAPLVRSAAARADTMRVEGERRFQANCGRCHAAPQKFPPRMMATIVRHMRVRAMITDEDMKLVLFYMTQ
jgi:mono/diheme cytochrome c family protein